MSSSHSHNDFCCDHMRSDTFAQTLDELSFERSICGAAASNDFERLKKIIEKRQTTNSKKEDIVNITDSYGYTALVSR